MRVLCLATVACFLSVPAQAQDKKNAEKLVGTWTVTKSEDAPPGALLEFSKDGKLKLTVTVEGKTISVQGTYKIEGDSIKVTMKGPDGKEKTETAKIKELTLKGDRITGGASFEVEGKPREIDGTGLVVAPGFIDLHSHSDYPILAAATRGNVNYLTQGVTTVVTGNCGAGPVDVGDYLGKIDRQKAGTNVAHQIPHNTLRQRIMGSANHLPTAAELDKMKALVDKGI